MNIPSDRIISATKIQGEYKEVEKMLKEKGILFIFKNNKPDLVIMTFDEYEKLYGLVKELDRATEVKKWSIWQRYF